MIKYFLSTRLTLFLLLLSLPLFSQNNEAVVGDWSGALEVGPTKLRLVFHIMEKDGGLSATMDSPDQGARGIPVTTTTLDGTTLTLIVASASAQYQGKFNKDFTKLEGSWSQGGQQLPLTLAKGGGEDFTPFEGNDFSPLLGSWQGKLNVNGTMLRLVFNFSKTASGKLIATLDSPDQGAEGIAISKASLKDNKIILKAAGIGATYKGEFTEDGQKMSGVWEQGPGKMDLNMERSDEVIKINRPQHPNPPFPYQIEEVKFTNSIDQINLAGTLTIPPGEGPFPAAVLISGSGPQDRDETLMGHKPFWVIADFFARQNIAVLRYDDRGVGGSEGDFQQATTRHFANDAAAGAAYLRTRTEIRADKVGLVGHSEGGLVAPMVAAKYPETAFAVLMAGPAMKGFEILRIQVPLISRANGQSEEFIQQQMNGLDSVFHILTSEKDKERQAELVRAYDRRARSRYSESLKKEMEVFGDLDALLEQNIKAFQSPWFELFLNYDPVPTLKKVGCPVLAINGELDLQVTPNENLELIESSLKAGGNKQVIVKEFTGLNHLFQKAETGSPKEYATIEETFSEEVMQYMTDWIQKMSK